MSKKLLYIIVIIFFCISLFTNAQSVNRHYFTAINYNSNVSAPINNQEEKKLQEVYGEKLQDYILNNHQRLKDIKNILRNRVSIVELLNYRKEYKPLSEVSLFNNYNKNLTREHFDKNTFNPLKYNFDFYSKGTKIYKVDHTNYYIIIKSQYQQ